MSNQIRCVYCFGEFLPHEAHFRAKGPIHKREENQVAESLLYGKEETESKHEDFVLDEKLKYYYHNLIKLDIKVAENNSILYPVFTLRDSGVIYKEAKNELGRQYVAEIFFDEGTYDSAFKSTDQRLCPHCHNSLPTGFGIRDSIIISLIGDTFSGKTVYMTVLLESLKRDKYFRSTLNAIGDKDVLSETIRAYHEAIYQRREVPDATLPGRMIKPLLYTYTFNYKDRDLNEHKQMLDVAIYDIAGENCRDAKSLEEKGFNVKNSDGIIFLLNPLAFDNVANYFGAYDSSLVNGNTNTNSQLEIIDALYNYFIGTTAGCAKIPTAFVISKIDMLSRSDVKLPFFQTHPHTSIVSNDMYNDNVHQGYLDQNDIFRLDYDVRDFLSEMDNTAFINSAENHFETFSFFSMSSLNQIPVETEENGVKVGKLMTDMKPFRVKDPFYWILAKNGYIDIIDPTFKKPPKKKGFFSLFKG